MNYANIKTYSIENGTGVRVSLFVSGCTHHCKGCFNEEAWDFSYGKPFTKETEDEIIHDLEPDYMAGITLLGGEPMEVANQKALRPFMERIKKELPEKTIWIYSGYTYEELMNPDNIRCHSGDTETILAMADVLVDGRFQIEHKDMTLRFRGSSNQRIIDLKQTRKCSEIILSDFGKTERIKMH